MIKKNSKKILSVAVAALLSSGAMAQTEKKAYMVADAHLDTQWNWDVQTTIRDYVKSTIDQNLMLLKKYPSYIFNFEGAVKYSWMKEYYPMQFAELKHYVANGRWHLTGSGWDANEVIICSPESWLRNILLGQTFYRQEFNTESTDVFLRLVSRRRNWCGVPTPSTRVASVILTPLACGRVSMAVAS